ncbi:MAG: hypothetical protein R3300_02575 [Candidatus Promineifilaceae bacterium]|nr:hypothetical protein [Candidatus Promineifilaceae bacterium]
MTEGDGTGMEPAELVAHMRRRWMRLMEAEGIAREPALDVFTDLVALYTGPDRHYHHLGHIAYILDALEDFREMAHDYRAMQLAAWFHDVIYDARATDNEAQSAGYAGRKLKKLGFARQRIIRIQELILATAGHVAPPGDIDAMILLDIDLSPLAHETERFFRESAAIRREFNWMPEPAYRAARARAMRKFLERERIYTTEVMYRQLEDRARQNLRAALRMLGHDPDDLPQITR